jgi:hypothetical protein
MKIVGRRRWRGRWGSSAFRPLARWLGGRPSIQEPEGSSLAALGLPPCQLRRRLLLARASLPRPPPLPPPSLTSFGGCGVVLAAQIFTVSLPVVDLRQGGAAREPGCGAVCSIRLFGGGRLAAVLYWSRRQCVYRGEHTCTDLPSGHFYVKMDQRFPAWSLRFVQSVLFGW